MARKKIAILGGGMGGLAAAWELTRPGARERFDVTVYELGGRLGGKGASSRNRARGDRIEEHGLHLLGGCYENLFMMLREAYQELGRPIGAPLATWRDAFLPQDLVVLEDRTDSGWHHWPQRFPRLPSAPGEHGTIATPRESFMGLLRWLLGVCVDPHPVERWTPPRDAYLSEMRGELQVALQDLVSRIGALSDVLRSGPVPSIHRTLALLVDRLRATVRMLFRQRAQDGQLRRVWLTLDFLASNIVGILDEGLLIPKRGPVSDLDHVEWLENLTAIDDTDYRAWLRRHGASAETVDAPMVRGTGDAVFNTGFEGAAGTAVNGLFRLNLTYRGSLFYRMAAGMGETVFAPLYLVLRRRGVDFRFFHRIDRLELDRDGVLARVHGARQAATKEADYHPLVDVPAPGGKLACWRAQPDWDQLEGGSELAASGIDLGSPAPIPGERAFVLEDFHAVVLAIPVGALAPITGALSAHSERWRSMVSGMKTTRTQSVQLWFDRSLAELGWTEDSAVVTGYADALDTWADMGHLVEMENDPAVKNVGYFCGSLSDDGPDAAALGRVEAEGRAWFAANLGHLLPHARLAQAHGQYWRANVRPWERYVLSVPGTMHLRMRSADSGIPRLFLAGDWVHTGMNVGSVEAAAMAGKQAARAISGRTIVIPGDVD